MVFVVFNLKVLCVVLEVRVIFWGGFIGNGWFGIDFWIDDREGMDSDGYLGMGVLEILDGVVDWL